MAARDAEYMSLALHFARQAARRGDVPVGAVVVVSGQVAGWGQNTRQAGTRLLGHAELEALEMACRHVDDWRLPRSTLYVTLEPCVMCAGAALQARVERVVFGCRDPRAGAVRSLYALCEDPRAHHRIEICEGVLADASRDLLQQFFEKLRDDSGKP